METIDPAAVGEAAPRTQPVAYLEFESEAATCAALALNGFPIVHAVSIEATEAIVSATLLLEIDGYPRCTISRIVDGLKPGERRNFATTMLCMPLELLRGFTERQFVDVHASLTDPHRGLLGSATLRVAIAPETHWPGIGPACQSLATFVTPNSPDIAGLLRDVSRRLTEKTGSGALDGYLSGKTDRVQRIAESCYEAVAALGLTYVVLQASFEENGQKVRSADAVLGDRLGNCLDLSVLLATVMEAAGLYPTIALGDGHAIVGFSINGEHFSDPIHRSPSLLVNRLELGEARVVEATRLCGDPGSFADAVQTARDWLSKASENIVVVDVKACRLANIHPLSEAIERNSAHSDAPVEAPTGDYVIVQPADLPPLPKPKLGPRAARIEAWKKKLLDLTLRNRLLNDVPLSQLPLMVEGEHPLSTLLDVLGTERSLTLRPGTGTPLQMLESAMADELRSGTLRTMLPETELFQRATKANRDGRSSLEETGARSLYVAVGFLEYFVEGRNTALHAPLLLVPITMERISRSEGFRVRMVADDIVANVALVEYLRVTQGKDINLSAQLVTDAGAPGIADVLAYVRQSVKDVPGARVVAAAKIGNYSFKKLPLFEEMRQRSHALAAHPVLGALLERDADPGLRHPELVNPSEVGRHARFASLRLPLPADSSQMAAVLSAASGKTFVLQGPPGTGKSQTITNLLVECMARGLRVLFVAEKSAALEVVSERLRKTGLGFFALDLHADNANKTQFVGQVKAALDALEKMHGLDSSRHVTASTELDTFSDRIRSATDALHDSKGHGLSVFDAIDRACGIDLRVPGARNHPALAGKIDGALSESAGSAEIAARNTIVQALCTAFSGLVAGSDRAFGDFSPKRVIGPEEAAQFGTAAAAAIDALAAWEDAASTLARTLGLPSPATPGAAGAQQTVARTLDTTHSASPWLARLALGNEPVRHLDDCIRALTLGHASENAMASVVQRYDAAILDQPLAVWAGDLREAREKMPLLRWFATRKVRSSLVRMAKTPPVRNLAALLVDIERLISEKAAIDAAVPVRELLKQFQSGGEPIDYASSRAAVDAAAAFSDTVRRLFPAEIGALAGPVPDAIAQGTIVPALSAVLEKNTAWSKAAEALTDCAALPGLDHPGCGFAALNDQLVRLRDNWRSLPAWSAFTVARGAAEESGLGSVAEALLTGALPAGQAPAAVEAEMLTAWTRRKLRSEPSLADCAVERMQPLRNTFREGMEMYRRGVPEAVAETIRNAARVKLETLSRDGNRNAVNVLTGLRAVGTIRRPIRRLMSEAAPAIAAIKPVVLASPLTASTHLPPDFPEFDLVVFDEASQVPVWDAACAITRGKACVIVGDSRQLPPTRFFDRKEGAETNADVSEDAILEDALEPLESVLDEAVASGLPQQSLLWHYRSRDERLIEFSNRRNYGAQLKTFPAPRQAHGNLGVEFRYVEGVYARGSGSTNRAEAKAVVDEIRLRLLDPDNCPANRSIGVVTFSVAQQTLVQDLLDEALDNEPLLRMRMADAARDGDALFVKNLENVQGDERATMLFSICYGKDQDGKLHYQFGPLNLSGGERRLNVAVSRAREKVVVFSSLRASDLDPRKCNSPGVRDLRDYLAFAEHGTVPATRDETVQPTVIEVNSLEQRLAQRLRARGFVVDLHVGRSHDYRVSLALARPESPGAWILGVELDGAFLRTAPTVADREVVRAGVLQSLGWQTISISAVDLMRDEDAVVGRIVDAANGTAVLVR